MNYYKWKAYCDCAERNFQLSAVTIRIAGFTNKVLETYLFRLLLQGVYVTEVYENSPAQHCGLKEHDKILQVNGYDFTMVTHRKAVEYIKRNNVLNMLVARKGVTHS